MQFDNNALNWAAGCAFACVLCTLLYCLCPIFPGMDRAFHTILGLISAAGMTFCGLLPFVKKLPKGKFKKWLQPRMTNGHPWVGLMICWTVLLHSNFCTIKWWTVHTLLYFLFLAVSLTGVISLYFRQFQVFKKDAANGSAKKQMAGWLMDVGYEYSLYIHTLICPIVFILLVIHVWTYIYYGRLW